MREVLMFFIAMSAILIIIIAYQPQSPQSPEQRQQKAQQTQKTNVDADIFKYMVYVQDTRTGLCFARFVASKGYYVYSSVECTSKVKEHLLNKER